MSEVGLPASYQCSRSLGLWSGPCNQFTLLTTSFLLVIVVGATALEFDIYSTTLGKLLSLFEPKFPGLQSEGK